MADQGFSRSAAEIIETQQKAKRWDLIADPKFVIQLLLFIGAVFAVYMASARQSNHVEEVVANLDKRYSEVAKNLDERTAKFEGQIGTIVSTVSAMSNVTTELRTKYDGALRDIEDLKRAKDDAIRTKADLEARSREISRQDGVIQTQQVYITNLRGRVDQLEATAKSKKGE